MRVHPRLEAALFATHPDTLGARHTYAITLKELGQLAAAEAEWESVVQSQITLLGYDHEDTLSTMWSLGAHLTRPCVAIA